MHLIRSTTVRSRIFTDSIDSQDGFQTLDLDFSPGANTTPWSSVFESHLHGLPPDQLCKKLDSLHKPQQQSHGTLRELLETPSSIADSVFENATHLRAGEFVPFTGSKFATTLRKRGVHYHQFSGSGTDAEGFLCNGILHPLPPQNGIPGWQRFTMMKYFGSPHDAASQTLSPTKDHSMASDSESSTSRSSTSSQPNTSPSFSTTSSLGSQGPNASTSYYTTPFTPINANPRPTAQDMDVTNGCWAYEGVVLPGRKIIVGRWWSPLQDPDEMICMGPFIFWEVDKVDETT